VCGEQLERGCVDVEAGLQGGRDQPPGCPRPRHQGWVSPHSVVIVLLLGQEFVCVSIIF
jgi:hypothetical protein